MDLFEHLLSAAQVWLATFAGVFLRVGACFFSSFRDWVSR